MAKSIGYIWFVCCIEVRPLSCHCLMINFVEAPLTPEVTFSVVNESTLQVSWDEPFTCEAFPITGYTVTITNFTNLLELRNLSVDTLSYYITESDIDFCNNLTFKVTATSDAGVSAPGVAHGAFPYREFTF